ncbi:MAG: RecX family transcriptional regulator [Syntrophales bacterium]|nr:RecX family transcriptional regulator [Syntrophales bacterium]
MHGSTTGGEDPTLEKAKQKAFRFLSVRGRSTKEIRSKLKERGFEESIVEKVIVRLLDLKYLDDESFAKQWARNLAVNRLYGNRRIEMSLLEKGIDRKFIEQSIAWVREEISEKEAINVLIEKKVKGKKVVELDEKEKRRLAQNLMGRGFHAGLIFEVLGRPEEEFTNDGK